MICTMKSTSTDNPFVVKAGTRAVRSVPNGTVAVIFVPSMVAVTVEERAPSKEGKTNSVISLPALLALALPEVETSFSSSTLHPTVLIRVRMIKMITNRPCFAFLINSLLIFA